MATAGDQYAAWVGRRELTEDDLCLAPALAAAAMLDDTTTPIDRGSCLPPLWHWFYFVPRVAQARLGADGHPERGGFMPPIPFPRRMFAGARLRFHRPLIIGRSATRESEIRAVSVKVGRSGPLAFVSVVHRFFQNGDLHLEEEQDIVYREPGPAVPRPRVAGWSPPASGMRTRLVTPDPRLLFRFSALTFNAHRIHYDRPYAMAEEGYPGLVVHGPLTALLLCEFARAEAERPIGEFSFRALAPLFDLAPFRLLCSPEEGGLALEAQGPDGSEAMRASARFSTPQTG
ncbi:MaoC family dehydratase N-terminal domain-containing protein [Accumulibacter sp.]|uniref:FAS1-like dehydratase domain-containing protein n=1 Tax=Accumulibacter sp. TaxID=2053492 RepID=UPI0025FB2701|nr:MaoC family dehydratase N-terminal domain-containing protein [Accumulibacter sp.]MCM8596605.1 MaoC family dehydratase N-terminal domain-containing protein [Accumulibacter sp.]MCM8627524.1 MaoC family dehydratase N-terminal domain-containing protein [Accumulibacter sp.]MDS4050753.1 MaoC family dehydratase N-terminal domain-containing protein [Accumulibacter sp.]